MFSVALLLLLLAGSRVNSETLTQPASMIVQPGEHLTITCQVSYSLGSYPTAWIRQPAGKGLEWIGRAGDGWTTYYKDSLKNKFSISFESSSKTVTLRGTNVQPEDTAVYYCARDSSGYGYFDYWGKGTQVTVTSATSTKPTVFPLVPCGTESGDMVTLGCLATGFNPPAVTFSWTKGDTALTDFIQYPAVQKGDVYTGVSQVRVRKQDWGTQQNFQCVVNHAAGNAQADIRPTQASTPNPPVSTTDQDNKGKPTVAVYIPPTDQFQSEDKITLVCLVTSTVDETYKIEWSEMFGKTQGAYVTATDIPPQRSKNDQKWRSMSLYTISKANWDKKNPTKEFTCRVGVGPKHIFKTVSSAHDDFCDLSWDDITAEDDFGSLWSTASSFIFLFIFSLFYSIIISLLKVNIQFTCSAFQFY
ncbi:immunoglobulin mu heavy chain-like isoform X2 [Simochromis diagramma]|uniref:immunoglobulin mu heavy chain-like isoform X2 n=1 Tax=Simochromis diagramma TaxID=43689 RepID=UPI001A7EFDB9|nr:immunoglobulin mu heavy chain-like isoform X2 [Simochromis diagramma]